LLLKVIAYELGRSISLGYLKLFFYIICIWTKHNCLDNFFLGIWPWILSFQYSINIFFHFKILNFFFNGITIYKWLPFPCHELLKIVWPVFVSICYKVVWQKARMRWPDSWVAVGNIISEKISLLYNVVETFNFYFSQFFKIYFCLLLWCIMLLFGRSSVHGSCVWCCKLLHLLPFTQKCIIDRILLL